MKRHEMRQLALQALYQVDVGKAEITPAVLHALAESGPYELQDEDYITGLVRGVWSNLSELDGLLEKYVEGWKIDRIARVDLNVLRLALYELLYVMDVDFATILNEAVELAKHYSTEESGRFVNGVLARLLPVAKERR